MNSTQLFETWRQLCCTNVVEVPPSTQSILSSVELRDLELHIYLQTEAYEYYASYDKYNVESSLTKIQESIVMLTTLLAGGPLQELVSYKSSTATTSTQKLRALFCLSGALRGCCAFWKRINNSRQQEHKILSSILTGPMLPIKTIELIGNYVTLHCAPYRNFLPSPTGYEAKTNTEDLFNQNFEEQSLLLEPTEIIGRNIKTYTDDDVRDAAVDCIAGLLVIPWEPVGIEFPFHPSSSNYNSETSSLDQIICVRTILARKAIQHRCQSLSEEDEMGAFRLTGDLDDDSNHIDRSEDQDLQRDETNGMLFGLSLLSRSKRSLCFSVFESAIRGIREDLDHYSSAKKKCNENSSTSDRSKIVVIQSTLEELRSFTSFASGCLLGETDPRCLMQMLKLLHETQLVFTPLFVAQYKPNIYDVSDVVHFPTVDLFDAVAPYYPVQFTPPPNDRHGITKVGLHGAIMSIFCFLDETLTLRYSDDSDEMKDSMTSLAARLFLDQVWTNGGPGEEINVQDQLCAIDDLIELLLERRTIDTSASAINLQIDAGCYIFHLSQDVITDLASSLLLCHEDSSLQSSPNEKKQDQAKQKYKILAESCRKLACRLAYIIDRALSHADKTAILTSFFPRPQKIHFFWQTFTVDIVTNCANTISSSPQSSKGRTSMAYIASLSACGGLQTLSLCLEKCMPLLLEMLSDEIGARNTVGVNFPRDGEKYYAVVNGIAAVFSSSRVSMELIHKDRGHMQKHPLQPYAGNTIRNLFRIVLGSFTNTNNENDSCSSVSMSPYSKAYVVAIKAIESVILCTPSNILSSSDLDYARTALLSLTEYALQKCTSAPESFQEYEDWNLAISRLVGSMMGKSMKSHTALDVLEGDYEPQLLYLLEDYARTKLFHIIFATCMGRESEARLGRRILSIACEAGSIEFSEQVVFILITHLTQSILDKRFGTVGNDPINIAMTLSYVIRNGGSLPRSTLHDLATPHFTFIDLIAALTKPTQSLVDVGTSTLMLPSSREEVNIETRKAISFASSIVPCLLCVYSAQIPPGSLEALISLTSSVLPPLTEWDNVTLCVALPFLSEAFHWMDQVSEESAAAIMLPYLTEYYLGIDNEEHSRSAAASCVFSVIAKFSVSVDYCPARKLLCNMVFPEISKCMNVATANTAAPSDELDSLLSLVSLVGTAAARRGYSSSSTADLVSQFLCRLSCSGILNAARIGCEVDNFCAIFLYDMTYSGNIQLQLSSAKAFGSMLSVDTGSPITRQRLAFSALPIILLCCERFTDTTMLGCLTSATHILCCVAISPISRSHLSRILDALIDGLSLISSFFSLQLSGENTPNQYHVTAGKGLVPMILSALLKVSLESHSSIVAKLPKIVPGLLLWCNCCSNGTDTISSTLIALQLLVSVANSTQVEAIRLCRSFKSKVLLYLSTLICSDSFHVRQAAVAVRNIWAIL